MAKSKSTRPQTGMLRLPSNSTASPPTFTLFPKLPREVQLIIWSFAIPEPRRITMGPRYRYKLRARTRTPQDIIGLKADATNPGILHASHDSRKAALKIYSLAFATPLSGCPIYFDFDRDELAVTRYRLFEHITFPQEDLQVDKECDQLRKLAVRVEHVCSPNCFLYHTEHLFTHIALSFPCLEKLTLYGPAEKWWKDAVAAKSEDVKNSVEELYDIMCGEGDVGVTHGGEVIKDPKAPLIGFETVEEIED